MTKNRAGRGPSVVKRIFSFAVLASVSACGDKGDRGAAVGDCDPVNQIVIVEPGGVASGAGGSGNLARTDGDGGRASEGGNAGAGGSAGTGDSGSAGSSSGGAGSGLSTGPGDFCVVAPWTNAPAQFTSESGTTNLPAGTYTLRYLGGAQIHDATEGYEVSSHYDIGGIQAGHHIYNGSDPSSSSTSIWLDPSNTVGSLPSVAAAEQANAGSTWTIQVTAGPLFITYYDNDYSDNQGPGSQFCIETQSTEGSTAQAGGAAAPPYHELTKPGAWSTLDSAAVNIGSGYASAAFDGRYVYGVPGGSGIVPRYDTQAELASPASWSTFNVTALSSSTGFRGAAFDGRYVYFIPYTHGDASLSGTVTRYDTQASFAQATSWSTFDVSRVNPGAKGFVGGQFDGRYLYLVPYGTEYVLSGVVARYDTQASFADPKAWTTFDTRTVNPNAEGYYGATFDGRYLYLSPYSNGYGSYSHRF